MLTATNDSEEGEAQRSHDLSTEHLNTEMSFHSSI